MIVSTQHPWEGGLQCETYQNVASVLYEYQPENGINGSLWLTLRFKKDSPEGKEYKGGEISIGIDPMLDTFQIYKDSK